LRRGRERRKRKGSSPPEPMPQHPFFGADCTDYADSNPDSEVANPCRANHSVTLTVRRFHPPAHDRSRGGGGEGPWSGQERQAFVISGGWVWGKPRPSPALKSLWMTRNRGPAKQITLCREGRAGVERGGGKGPPGPTARNDQAGSGGSGRGLHLRSPCRNTLFLARIARITRIQTRILKWQTLVGRTTP